MVAAGLGFGAGMISYVCALVNDCPAAYDLGRMVD